METERRSFLEELQYSKNAPLTSEQAVQCRTITRDIVKFALSNPDSFRFQEMPDGHLRIYSLGQEDEYDSFRKFHYTALTISISETNNARDPSGKRVEITGKITINPNDTPFIHIERKGNGDRTSWGHTLTPDELEAVLKGLEEGSPRDPRKTNWRQIIETPHVS